MNNVYFSPGTDCLHAICEQMNFAMRSIDICVFTISDNRIAGAIRDAHNRGIKVRIISDDEKRFDRGSDIAYLERMGLDIKIDNSPHHMHHKFAVIDRVISITGSYNWTRSAEKYNNENVLITDNQEIAEQYQQEFDRLWSKMKVI